MGLRFGALQSVEFRVVIGFRVDKGFPKMSGTILGVPIIRIVTFWGLYWGPLILGNNHIRITVKDCMGIMRGITWDDYRYRDDHSPNTAARPFTKRRCPLCRSGTLILHCPYLWSSVWLRIIVWAPLGR